jgi:hypothetical protein
MNKLKFFMSFVAGWFLFEKSNAGDTFNLLNNRKQTVELQFFRTESEPRWLEKPYQVLKNGGKTTVYLESIQPHTVFIHDSTGRVERLENVDFHNLLLKTESRTLTLIQLFVPETKTARVQKTIYQTETRSSSKTISRMIEETRTRVVEYTNNKTGKIEERTETYTVKVPVTSLVEETYTVQVPLTVSQETAYSVVVEKSVFAYMKDGVLVPLTPNQANGTALEQPDNLRDSSSVDGRKRTLGVTLQKGEIGSTVKSVQLGSPATNLKLAGKDDGKRYTLVANRHSIVKVNGIAVDSVDEILHQLQLSPPLAVLEVYDKQYNTIMVYEAQLRME